MAARDFFSHTGADGSTAGRRLIQASFIFDLVAKNIPAGQTGPMEAIRT